MDMDPIGEARKAWQGQQQRDRQTVNADAMEEKNRQEIKKFEETFLMEAREKMCSLLGPVCGIMATYEVSYTDIRYESSGIRTSFNLPEHVLITHECWRFILFAERAAPDKLSWKYHLHLYTPDTAGQHRFIIELNNRTDFGQAIDGLENHTWDGWLNQQPEYGSA